MNFAINVTLLPGSTSMGSSAVRPVATFCTCARLEDAAAYGHLYYGLVQGHIRGLWKRPLDGASGLTD